MGLTKERYDSIVAHQVKVKETIFYTINVTCDSGEFLLIVKTPSNFVDSIPADKQDLGLSALKKNGRAWQPYPITEKDAVLKLPWKNLAELKEILRLKRAHMGAFEQLAAGPANSP